MGLEEALILLYLLVNDAYRMVRHRQLDGLVLPVWWSAGLKDA